METPASSHNQLLVCSVSLSPRSPQCPRGSGAGGGWALLEVRLPIMEPLEEEAPRARCPLMGALGTRRLALDPEPSSFPGALPPSPGPSFKALPARPLLLRLWPEGHLSPPRPLPPGHSFHPKSISLAPPCFVPSFSTACLSPLTLATL